MNEYLKRITSRKFILALSTAIITFGNHFYGWGITDEQMLLYISPILLFITVEGIADVNSRKTK